MTKTDLRLSKNFYLSEFTKTETGLFNQPSGIEITNLKTLVREIMQPLRDFLKGPIIIGSAYRSVDVNYKVGGARFSQHLFGEACDFWPAEQSKTFLCYWWLATNKIEYNQLIYYVDQKHIHVALGRKRQLLYKKNGKLLSLKKLILREWELLDGRY